MQKWFDRSFDFTAAHDLEAILERLTEAPNRIVVLLDGISEQLSEIKPGGKWSVKEHLGHLAILEPLWRKRIADIQAGTETLTPADLENNETTNAGLNNYNIDELTGRFAAERNETILLLKGIDAVSVTSKSFHPRLQQPMSLADHLYFVAEHDDHHIATVKEILVIEENK